MSAKRTSVQIYESTRIELTKVMGQLSQDGKKRSYDEAIVELIQFWIENRKKK
jgi:hypothetical protein